MAGIVAACAAYFLVILDAGVLNLALPAIRADLATSLTATQWTITGYTLMLAALLMPAGALADRWGVRPLLVAGVIIFAAASGLCAAAGSLPVLVFARVIQGAGGAALLPSTLAAVAVLFPAGRLRDRATMAWVATGAVAMAVAPFLGGALVQVWGWRAIFAVNLPVGLVACVLGWRFLPRSRSAAGRVSWPGQGLVALVLAGVTVAFALAATPRSGVFVVAMAIAIMATAGLIIHERAGRNHVVPKGFFADGRRLVAVRSAGMMGFIFYAVLLYLSLWFQQALG